MHAPRTTLAKNAALLFALLASAACAGETAETPAESPETAEAEAPAPMNDNTDMVRINPNLAGEAEMVAVGVSEEVAAAVVAARPFMDMIAVDQVLAAAGLDEAAREAVYANVWIPINLNTASEEEILLIPGVGDRMAHEFDEYRPYAAMAEFDREIGKYVDEDEVARLASYVFLPIDLNTASREEILAIPGVGERMAHEFEEYRPYTDMAQFRREIGKYVDEAEVARLERYVVIN